MERDAAAATDGWNPAADAFGIARSAESFSSELLLELEFSEVFLHS
jgi:hypothetical protein